MKSCNYCKKSDNNNYEKENMKLDIIKNVIGIIIFILAIINIFSTEIRIILYIISYIISGYEVVIKAIKNIFKGEFFDENSLMTIATIGALLMKEFPEAALVMILYNCGEMMGDYATEKSKKSIISLMDIKAKFANLKIKDEIKKVSPEQLKIDDIIIIKPGEKIPVDGVIISGNTSVNTATLSGEAMPKEIKEGEEVLAGYTNENGLIEVKVTRLFKDTEVAEIIELVKNATEKKAKTEKFITKFSKIYTPIVFTLALLIAIIPPIITKQFSFYEWIHRALVFLVTSCPCALVLSIPIGYFAGLGASSKNGVLIKGSNYLDELAKIDAIGLDKTGTITKGNFEVSKIEINEGINNERFFTDVTVAEKFSNHPVASSIINKIVKIEIQKDKIKSYKEIAGIGIEVIYNDKIILVGNHKLMEKENIKFNEAKEIGTIIYVAENKEYLGYIVIQDTIKENSKNTIDKLKKMGIKYIYMLTGDNKKTADYVGEKVGIKNIYSNLLPNQKVEILEKLKHDGKNVMAVGDGINDSPVLAIADVGVAIGNTGADLAIEAADCVIMNENLESLIPTIKIARKTKKIIIENIYFAIIIKLIILILGAFGYSNMWQAVFADVGVTLLTVLNTIRILKIN